MDTANGEDTIKIDGWFQQSVAQVVKGESMTFKSNCRMEMVSDKICIRVAVSVFHICM